MIACVGEPLICFSSPAIRDTATADRAAARAGRGRHRVRSRVPRQPLPGALAVGIGTGLFTVPDLAAQVSSLASSRRVANQNAAAPTTTR